MSQNEYCKEAHPTICRSIGYLLKKDAHEIVVMQTMSSDTGHMSDSMAIPWVAVRKMRVLKGGL